MKRIVLAVLLSSCVTGALAQGCGPSNPNCIVPTAPIGTNNTQAASTQYVQQNISNSTILSPAFDAAFCSARGALIERTAGGWACLNGGVPGTLGLPLVANGPSADPAYGVCGLNGGCLGASQAAATINQIPVYPGGAGAATPTSATTWFDNAYCNTIGFAIVRLTGAWTCAKYIAANPVWWGADPTGVSDSTSAFNSAIAASTVIEFPFGKFRFNSALSYTFPNGLGSFTIKGQGQGNTILFWPNASGGLSLNFVNALNTGHVRDLTLTTGQAGGGTGLTFTSTAHTQGISDIYRVELRGDDGYNVADYWNIGVFSHYVSNLNVEGLLFEGQGATGAGTLHGLGIQVEGAPAIPDYAVQVNIAKSAFQAAATGILYGSYLQGLTVDQCNFSVVGNGIQSNSAETGTLAQLSVTNSQFGLFNNSGVGILTLTTIINTTITNNYFVMSAPGTNSVAIWLSSFNHFNIVGNSIGSPAVANGLDGILLGTATAGGSGVISANDIFLFATGINIGASATGVLVVGNTLEGNTTAITNANTGTSNVIVNNSGYNPVGPAAITVGASPFTYTAGASPETVYAFGGTVTGLAFDKNGGALTTAACNNTTPCSLDLGPYEQVKVTYTVAPTMNKMIH